MNFSRLTILSALTLYCAASSLSAAELTSDQRAQLLQEATSAYEQGLHSASNDVAAAKDAFATAADKYRLLVESGVENPRLYENLGHAALQSGRLGEAIAAYEHAAVLAPSDASIRQHLEHARSLRDGGTSAAESVAVMDRLATWNHSVPMNLRIAMGLSAWTLFWAACLGGLISRSPRRWRRAAIGAGVIAALMAGSIGWDWSEIPRTDFGIVTTPATIRTHNGETFPPVFDQPLSEGTRFDVMDQLGDWLHVRLADGTDGWIPNRSADVIAPPASPWG